MNNEESLRCANAFIKKSAMKAAAAFSITQPALHSVDLRKMFSFAMLGTIYDHKFSGEKRSS